MKDAAHVSALKTKHNENQLTLPKFRRCDTQLGVIEPLNIRNHALSSLIPDWKKNSTGNSSSSLPLKEAFRFTQIETSVFSSAFSFYLCICSSELYTP